MNQRTEFDDSMYDTDDIETPLVPAASGEATLAVINRGMVTELDINGKKFDVVNPEYARELQKLILDMSNKMRIMDRNMRSMDFAIKQQARMISDLRSNLDGKIDRE